MQIQRTKRLRHVLLFVCLSCMLLMTGCDTKPYSKDEVIEMTKQDCKEDFTLLYSEKVKKNHIKYTFETTGRKLIFTVDNSLETIDGPIPGRKKSCRCHYAKAVRKFYRKPILETVKQSPLYKDGEFHISHSEELENIAKIVEKCNQIYAEELAYHSRDFLNSNPVCTFEVTWSRSAKAEKAGEIVSVYSCIVNGCDTKEEILSALQKAYTDLYADSIIYDHDYHVKKLEKVYVNGKRMKNRKFCSYTVIYDSITYINRDYYESSTRPEDDFKDAPYVWYNHSLQQYMTSIEAFKEPGPGWHSIIANFTEALGGSCTVNHINHTIEWTIGKDTWVLHDFNDEADLARTKKITKNGKEILISVVTKEEDDNVDYEAHAGISLDDFTKLFNLKYTIDEDKGCVYFTSTEKKK